MTTETRKRKGKSDLFRKLCERGRIRFVAGVNVNTDWDCELPQLANCDIRNLEESGLNRETIVRNGIRTTDDAMVFPYRSLTGKLTGFERTRPHTRPADGRKYSQPFGSGSHPYFPDQSRRAVRRSDKPIYITEGEKKALALAQIGLAAIGLGGVWNWQRKRKYKDAERKLIEGLAKIDWNGREVVILFDFDEKRKGNVHHAADELASVLTRVGAKVQIVWPPAGPTMDDGRPGKNGIDDFLVSVGPKAVLDFLSGVRAESAVQSVEKHRRDVERQRKSTIGKPGAYLDRSPTGSGKSYADVLLIDSLDDDARSLNFQPTHRNCKEVENDYLAAGIEDVGRYPKFDDQTCGNFDEANKALSIVGDFGSVICPECSLLEICQYQDRYNRAREAKHLVATQKRGEVQMTTLMTDREYVAIHENPVGIFRPQYRAAKGFAAVKLIADRVVPEYPETYAYYNSMATIADRMDRWMRTVNEQKWLRRPVPVPPSLVPKNVAREMWRTMEELDTYPNGDAMRLVRLATEGELDGIFMSLDYYRTKAGNKPKKSLVGTRSRKLPTNEATVWINDATANPDDLSTVLGTEIEDRTPSGKIRRQNSVLQITADVTRTTTVGSAANRLRGIVHDLPQFERIGVLTHKNLIDAGLLDQLDSPYRERISMMEWFHGGQSRGSNEWMEKCDCILILGTPRVGASTIREHLITVGKTRAAKLSDEEAEWTTDYWSGELDRKNEFGLNERVTISTKHYTDHDWHAAYCDLVVGELRQAIGRGRGILKNGVPVYVVTREELGELISPEPFGPLTPRQAEILGMMTDDNGNPVLTKTGQLAKRAGIRQSSLYKILTELREAGRVRQIGRKGWIQTR